MSIPPPLTSQLTVLLFTDLLDSSKLKTQLGDRAYAEQVAAPHNRLFRELLAQFPGAAINNFMGDGYLATFARVSDAVNFALLFHQHLDEVARTTRMPMTRIGIHVGELISLEDGTIAGHAADMCARLMSLGGGRQTLLTRHVFDDAKQHVRKHPPVKNDAAPPELAWLAHGRYEFKGKDDDPLEVFEVGAVGFAPLTAPHDSEKVRRKLNADEEATLGWRPAIGQEVPSKPHWVLQKQLGAGGFGEVWLVKHRKTQEEKVFKFCFDPERLRSFKRELTLSRWLRNELGDRPDIAKIHDIRLDQPPFFLELDYAPLGNLTDWVVAKQGLLQLPLTQRLDLLARVCDAVEAAHSIDVLHKDLKPSNILMYDDRGEVKPRLCDFGIGVLADLTRLENADITRLGFTQTLLAANDSSRTGTRLYTPPEALMGQAFTKLGDVYALGVMLYQLVVGKFDQPIAYGWERDVAEGDLTGTPNDAGKIEQPSSIARAVYKETIGLAIEGNPTRRVPSAAELARLIRALPTTIATREAEETARVTELAKAETARKTRVFRIVMGLAASVLAVVSTLGAMSYVQWQRADEAKNAETTARLKETEALAKETAALLKETEAKNDAIKAKNEAVEAKAKEALALEKETLSKNEAIQAKEKAEKSEREAQAILDFVEDRVFAAGRPQGKDGGIGYDIKLSAAIKNCLNYLERDFKGQPRIEARLRVTLGWSYICIGDAKNALLQYEKAYPLLKENFGENHKQTISCLNGLSTSYSELGDYAKALSIQEDVVKKSKLFHPEDDANEMIYASNYAIRLEQMGRVQDALALREQILQQRVKKLGPNHLSTLNIMASIADDYRDLGRYQEALTIRQQILEKLKSKGLPSDHPDMLYAIAGVADSYSDANRYKEALEIRTHVLKIRQTTFGPDHPDTLNSRKNVASSFIDLGQYQEALKIDEETYSICKAKYPEDHPETIDSMTDYAGSLMRVGMYEISKKMYQDVFKIATKKFGKDHPETFFCMYRVGVAHEYLEEYDQALPIYEAVYEKRKSLYGPQHPETMEMMSELAALYSMMNKYDKSLALAEELIRLREIAYKKDGSKKNYLAHCSTLNRLAICLSDNNKHAEAVKLLEKADELMQRIAEEEESNWEWHHFMGCILTNRARANLALGNTFTAAREISSAALCQTKTIKYAPDNIHALLPQGAGEIKNWFKYRDKSK